MERKLGEAGSLSGMSHWEHKLRREHLLQEIIYLHARHLPPAPGPCEQEPPSCSLTPPRLKASLGLKRALLLRSGC